MFTIRIYGVPAPGGSKSAFAFIGTDGRPHARVVDANPKAKPWKSIVTDAIRTQYSGPAAGPTESVFVHAVFFLPRPKGHTLASGNKSSTYIEQPTTKPDLTKLWRSTEDACTGLLWSDDAQIVRQTTEKYYASETYPVGCLISFSFHRNRRPSPIKVKRQRDLPLSTAQGDSNG